MLPVVDKPPHIAWAESVGGKFDIDKYAQAVPVRLFGFASQVDCDLDDLEYEWGELYAK